MSRLDWREFNRRFDPYGQLALAEVERLYAQRHSPAWRKLADQVDTAADPTKVRVLLAGTRGCGKTTELIRLHARLAQDGADHAPVYLDWAEALPDDSGTLPILALIGATVRAAADAWEAPPLPKDPLSTALQVFGVAVDWLPTALRAVGGFAGWLPPSTNPPADTAQAIPWEQVALIADLARTRLNNTVNNEDRRSAEKLVQAVQAEINRLARATGRQPVLLLDGLDKRPDLDAVHRAIEDADLLLGLSVPMVLSGPMQLRRDPRFASLTLPGRFTPQALHNLPVVKKKGDDAIPCDEGIDLLVDLYQRRVADDAGVPFRELFADKQLRELAHASSGVVREFLHLVELAAQASRLDGHARIEDTDVVAAMRQRRHTMQTSLNDELWQVLARVYRSRRLEGGALGDELLFTNLIACYPNDDVWFRPHELLVPYIRDVLIAGDEE